MIRVCYLGKDIDTLTILVEDDDILVSAVGEIPAFLQHTTYNPANLFFKFLYRLRIKNGTVVTPIEKMLGFIWQFSLFGATGIYRQYASYLLMLSQKSVSVWDTEAEKLSANIKALRIDLVVTHRWRLLPESVISAPQHGAFNIHTSLLPRHRGALPVLWALKQNDRESGVTYMRLDSGMDSGDIIAQHCFSLESTDTGHTFDRMVTEVLAATLVHTMQAYCQGRITPTQQDHTKATFTARKNAYRRIDWQRESARDIYHKVQLFADRWQLGKAYTHSAGRKIAISGCANWETRVVHPALKGRYNRRGLQLLVYTIDGFVTLRLFRDLSFWESLRVLGRREKSVFT